MTASGAGLRDLVPDPDGGLLSVGDAIQRSLAMHPRRPVNNLADSPSSRRHRPGLGRRRRRPHPAAHTLDRQTRAVHAGTAAEAGQARGAVPVWTRWRIWRPRSTRDDRAPHPDPVPVDPTLVEAARHRGAGSPRPSCVAAG